MKNTRTRFIVIAALVAAFYALLTYLSLAFNPVSYTHLDVYKRQLQPRAAGKRIIADLRHTTRDRYFHQARTVGKRRTGDLRHAVGKHYLP